MTNASIAITGDLALSKAAHGTDEVKVTTYDLDRVQVSFPAEDGGDPTCKHCGETITNEGDDEDADWIDSEGESHCQSAPEDDHEMGFHEPETGPGTWCNSAAIIVDDDENSVTATISVGDPRGAFAFTVRKVDRSGYCKHCGKPFLSEPGAMILRTDPDLTGAVLTCQQVVNGEDTFRNHEPDGERLILHMPYPGEGMPHETLTELHAGTFLVGRG